MGGGVFNSNGPGGRWETISIEMQEMTTHLGSGMELDKEKSKWIGSQATQNQKEREQERIYDLALFPSRL